jgi:hypothetical protein
MFVLLPQTCGHVISIFLGLLFNCPNLKYFQNEVVWNDVFFCANFFGNYNPYKKKICNF